MKSNVLLLVPPDRESQAAVEEAIACTKQHGGRLIVVVALDPEAIERVSVTLTNIGFMGEKVSDQVGESLLREYRTRAECLATAIARQAEQSGVPSEAIFEEGDPSEICRRLIPRHDVGVAILVAERRSWLARLLARDTVRVPALAGCEVRVIEDDR
jgi:nucleotide-binding universal stress UspA family protein